MVIELKWDRTHGELASRSAPAHAGARGDLDRAPFLPEQVSLWEALTDSRKEWAMVPLADYSKRLDDHPVFRRGQVAELLVRLQQRLDKLPSSIDADELIELQAGDLLLITHLLLRHQA